MGVKETIRQYYDANVQTEWERIANRPEYLITCRFMARYIQPGETVLDIGGGPGRYSLWLAGRGCKVTLCDLSAENVQFAKRQAELQGLELNALQGDALYIDSTLQGPFDHVLLMGPLYHLLTEAERVQAVQAALGLLKPDGNLYASFIALFSNMIYLMTQAPERLVNWNEEEEREYFKALFTGQNFAGPAFTPAFFIQPKEVLPFMAQFPLKKLHLFSQEGILSPCEETIMRQPPEILQIWLEKAEQLAEREELFSWAEHLMYIGKKGEEKE